MRNSIQFWLLNLALAVVIVEQPGCKRLPTPKELQEEAQRTAPVQAPVPSPTNTPPKPPSGSADIREIRPDQPFDAPAAGAKASFQAAQISQTYQGLKVVWRGTVLPYNPKEPLWLHVRVAETGHTEYTANLKLRVANAELKPGTTVEIRATIGHTIALGRDITADTVTETYYIYLEEGTAKLI